MDGALVAHGNGALTGYPSGEDKVLPNRLCISRLERMRWINPAHKRESREQERQEPSASPMSYYTQMEGRKGWVQRQVWTRATESDL